MAPTRNERRRQWQRLGYFWVLVMQAIMKYHDMQRRTRRLPRAPHRNWDDERDLTLRRMFCSSDRICREQLRMKIGPFERLCARLWTYGLSDGKSVSVKEQLVIFLNTVGHDHRNRATSFAFFRSGQTVFHYFHRVLQACLRLYKDVVTNATIHNSPYEKENVKHWYDSFQDAVGAIDGTHIVAHVPLEVQARYRNRMQVISQNVLVACTFDMKFTYVLAGWEGSAHDGRLLRSAIQCQGHKLTIPCVKYYLVDAGFPLVPGFLAPYRKTRYHRRDIEGQRPENSKELFNFRHSSLRNVVERTIGLLKKRFTYLRHQPYHDIETQAKIVLACCAIHNFLRIDDVDDILDDNIDSSDDDATLGHDEDNIEEHEDEAPIAHISLTAEDAWSNGRDTIANLMWDDYHIHHDVGIDFE